MKNSFFTISMGFVNREPNYPKTTDRNNIYTDIMRGIGQELLSSGARIYLPLPVDLIKSEEEVFDIIARSGYCMASFNKEMSRMKVVQLCKSFIRSYAIKVIDNLVDDTYKDDVDDFVECFKPYIVSVANADDLSLIKAMDRSMSELDEVIERGRNLTLDTKPVLLKVIKRLNLAEVVV